MTKRERIKSIYKILRQYEKIGQPGSNVTVETYKNYLDRLYVWYLGYGVEEIYIGLKGLYMLGDTASHDTVKRMVFHIIDILKKEV